MTIPKTFMSPQTTAEVVDTTRTAPSIDPTKAQPLDKGILQNGRMPESVSQAIKANFSGTSAQELDHIMPLELGGSNNKTNLRLENNVPGTKNTPTDPLENKLAQDVYGGKLSLVDSWRQMAKAKGITIQEDKALNSPLNDWLLNTPNVLKPLADAQDAITGTAGKVGDYFKGLFSNPNKTVNESATPIFNAVGGQALVHPVDTFHKIVDRASTDEKGVIQNLVNSATQVVANGADPKRMNDPKNVADILNLYGAAASTLFLPISELFNIASQLPVIKPAADAVGLIFDKTGKLGGFAAGTLLDTLPISQQAKDTLQRSVEGIGGLAGQVVLGGYVYGKITGAMDAKSEIPRAHEVAIERDVQKKAEELNKAAVPEPKTEAPKIEAKTPTSPVKPSENALPAMKEGEAKTEAPQPKAGELNPRGGSVSPEGIAGGVKENVQNVKDFLAKSQETGKASTDLQGSFNNLRTSATADEIRAKELLKNSNLDPKDAEAIYHYSEDKSIKLTDEQQKIYDEQIKPLQDARQKMFEKLKNDGLPMNSEDYTPRFVADRGGVYERLADTGRKIVSGMGGLLGKSASSFKHRVMMAFEDTEGNRKVVSIKDNRITAFENGKSEDLGRYDSRAELNKGTFTDKNGKDWKITDATTKEIEANTNLKYHKNVLLNELLTYNKLRQIDRASQFLDSFKESPQFEKYAMKFGTANIPKGWHGTELPQFRGYAFDPKIADVLDSFAKQMKKGGDILAPLTKANQFLRTAIFYQPFLHVPNIAVHWLVNRGVTKFAIPTEYASLYRSSDAAVSSILHPDVAPKTGLPSYTELLDKGANLQYSGTTKTLTDLMRQKMGEELMQNKPLLKQMGDALGYANPMKLVDLVFGRGGVSSKITWFTNDLATIQAIYDEMGHGKTAEEAITDVGKHIPNYQIPSRVLGSKALAEAMKNPNITMFSAYHYGAIKSYGEMVKSLLSGTDIKERGEALDKLAMMGLITLVIYPQLDKLAKQATGNPNAQMRRAGASTVPYNAYQTATGKMDYSTFLQSILTPSVGSKLAVELATNRDLFSGNQLIRQGSVASDLGSAVAKSIAPVYQASQITSGTKSIKQFLAGLIGVNSPKNTPSVNNLNAMLYTERTQRLSDIKNNISNGDTRAAQAIIDEFNNRLLQNAKDAIREAGRTPPSDDALKIKLSSQLLKMPTDKTMQTYGANHGKNTVQKLGL